MRLRFIPGRAGTGKTRLVLREVLDELVKSPTGPALLLLVPEQATFTYDRTLTLAAGGTARAAVVSFKRLAYRVLTEAGGIAHPAIGDLGRRMALRALLERRREELKLFSRVADRPGFIEKLGGTLAELRQYGKTWEHLQEHLADLEARGQGDTSLGLKLHDLALVMGEYEGYLEGRFTDPDGTLDRLAEKLGASRLCHGATVWVDGFSGFTPQEFAVLGALMQAAASVTVTLPLDPRAPQAPAFLEPRRAYDRLQRLARETGVRVEVTEPPTPPRPPYADGIKHLEERFFTPGAPAWEQPAAAVQVVEAPTRRAEVDWVAGEVRRLCRDEGYRYREVALVLRDFEPYHDLLAAAFRALDIPFFLDRRRPVPHHPLVELLRAALEVVVSRWRNDPVFRFLKTDLVPVERDAIDRLENYVREHGIRGSRWYEGGDWTYYRRLTLDEDEDVPGRAHGDLAAINAVRRRATAALLRFDGRLQGPLPTRDLCLAVWDLLEDLGVPRRLEQWSEAAAEGRLDEAQEHLQVLQGVRELLDQAVESLGEAVLTPAHFLEVLEAGLEGLRLRLVPPGLDAVLIGSVERSRYPQTGLKAAFVLGLNDRAFPRAPEEDAIFSDREREALDAAGFELGPTSRTRLFQENFLLYTALTRASQRLYLSYPIADEQGRALAISPALVRVMEILPHCTQVSVAADHSPDACPTPAALAAAVARHLRAARQGAPLVDQWLAAYQALATHPRLREAAQPLLAGLRYSNRVDPLARELAGRLYGRRLRTSVSRLESFAACPFQHLSRYGLRLTERREWKLESAHLGLLYHHVLRDFAAGLRKDGIDWAALTSEESYRRVEAVVDAVAPRLQNEILLSDARHRYVLRNVRRTLQAAVDVLSEHARRGQFRPVGVEVQFGEPPGLPAWRIETQEGIVLELTGRIDRVDAAALGDRLYLRVIDYKSYQKRLRLEEIVHGIALQLLLYLLVAVEHSPALAGQQADPAGVLYFPVRDPIVPKHPEEIENLDLFHQERLKSHGLVEANVIRLMDNIFEEKSNLIDIGRKAVTAEQFQILFRHLRELVGGLAVAITAGQAAVSPYLHRGNRPCITCPYKPVCRFDTGAGDRYRPLPLLRDADVWGVLTPHE